MTEDIENFKFNTAISQMMVFVNDATEKEIGEKQWNMFVRVLAPFAPHIAEELWLMSKNKGSVHVAQWPKFDPKKMIEETVTIMVQVNGKVRGQVQMPVGSEESVVRAEAVKQVEKWLEGKEIRRFIYVKDRLANIVI